MPTVALDIAASQPVSIAIHAGMNVEIVGGDGRPPGERPPGERPPVDRPPPPDGPASGMIESEAPIAIGDEGDPVTQVQEALTARGHDIDIDGDFGTMTQTAVRTFQAARRLPVTGFVDAATGAALDRVDRRLARRLHATVPGAPWVSEMRACTGIDEVPGSANSPIIMAWRMDIAHAFAEMANYAAQYTGDDVAWCGFGLGAAMARCRIRPPFGPTDTDKFMWADSWARHFGIVLPRPIVGCVMTFTREGGGHVAILEKLEGNTAWIRGMNQSDSVTVTTKSMDEFTAATWPEGWPVIEIEGDTSNTAPPGSES